MRPPTEQASPGRHCATDPARAAAPDAQAAWTVYGEGQDHWTADAVVLACPAYQQAVLLADLDPELAGRIEGIAYNRVAVVALGYRRTDVPVRSMGSALSCRSTLAAICSEYSGVRPFFRSVPRRVWYCCGRCAAAGIGRRS